MQQQTILIGELSERLSLARAAMEAEAEAIHVAATRLGANLLQAVDLIRSHTGKVVITGIGKSGLVAQKMVATFCSIGAPAVFLHPADALHGDLGVYEPGDPTILISKSGSTIELVRLVPMLQQFASPRIGILGNTQSKLGDQMDVVLDASVRCEADPCNIAPTCSAAVAMALGDALASALMQARNFTVDDFAKFHAGGQLGKNLLLTVEDAFHPTDQVACVRHDSTAKEVVIAMSEFPLGAACVIHDNGHLHGIITDGDLRRALQMHDDIRTLRAAEIMTVSPISIGPKARLKEALQLMEDRISQISVLPVVDSEKRFLGLIRIHDIYNPTGILN